jgi:two-component system, chemotaxis family, protein-glutamate methylesterase/glutaminase
MDHPKVPLNRAGIKRDIIVIGASAGGVVALKKLFASLPTVLPAAVGVVLHRRALPGHLATVLGDRSSLPIIEPYDGDALRQGTIYLAPADHHMLFQEGRIGIQRGPKEHSTRPAIDTLFRSAAAAFGARVVGVLLTGCGEDGVRGMTAIEEAGGIGMVQDPQEAEMPSMPLNAIRHDHVKGVFPVEEMASVLGALARGCTSNSA